MYKLKIQHAERCEREREREREREKERKEERDWMHSLGGAKLPFPL